MQIDDVIEYNYLIKHQVQEINYEFSGSDPPCNCISN